MIEVKQLCKRYGNKQILKDISFTAKKGEITCLLGVNGTGKTTLMNAMMHLTPIQKGTVIVDGEAWSQKMYDKIAYVPDRSIALANCTIEQSFDWMAEFYPSWNADKAHELVEFFQLNKNDRVKALSKGNVAKLNILLGLAQNTDYLVMDEPFSGIDVFTREQIVAAFTSRLVENKGVILTTHEIAEIEPIVDKVVLLKEGSVALEFYPSEYLEQQGKTIVDVMREVYR